MNINNINDIKRVKYTSYLYVKIYRAPFVSKLKSLYTFNLCLQFINAIINNNRNL